MPEICGGKYFPRFISFIPCWHIKSKTFPRNSFVSLRDTRGGERVYRILIKCDRVGELTIGLRNKKLVCQGRLFNPYSQCVLKEKTKRKIKCSTPTKNATGANNGRAEALLWWKQYGLLQATTRRTFRLTPTLQIQYIYLFQGLLSNLFYLANQIGLT